MIEKVEALSGFIIIIAVWLVALRNDPPLNVVQIVNYNTDMV